MFDTALNSSDFPLFLELKKHKAYHVVSAFVAESQITLEKITVDEKSNEITGGGANCGNTIFVAISAGWKCGMTGQG